MAIRPPRKIPPASEPDAKPDVDSSSATPLWSSVLVAAGVGVGRSSLTCGARRLARGAGRGDGGGGLCGAGLGWVVPRSRASSSGSAGGESGGPANGSAWLSPPGGSAARAPTGDNANIPINDTAVSKARLMAFSYNWTVRLRKRAGIINRHGAH